MNIIDRNNILPKLKNRQKVILELGCGQQKQIPDAIAIDIIDLPHIDIVADLNKGFKFLPDNSVDEIYSFHFMEHIDNLEFFIEEVYRILKPGGKKIGKVPHFSNPYFYSDYTHHHFFGLYTFSYFCKDKYFKRGVPNFYNRINFKINKIKIHFKSPFFVRNLIRNVWTIIFNSSKYMQELYEGSLCYIFPAYEIEFEIEKI